MRKLKPIWAGIALSSILILSSGASAQYGGDPYRSYTDQMVLDNINRRRWEATRKAQRNGRKSRNRKSSQPKRTARRSKNTTARRVANVLPLGTLCIGQDMYNNYGRENSAGFTMIVSLTPLNGGKTISRKCALNGSNSKTNAIVNGIPAGRYLLSARVLDEKGNSRPVLIGTQIGSPTKPNSGNFTPSRTIEMKLGRDIYGRPEVQAPSLLWFRV